MNKEIINKEIINKEPMTKEQAKEFLGVADNCTIQVNSVGNDCYRVNIYEKIEDKNNVIHTAKLTKSYYIKQDNNSFTDITISK